MSKKNRKLSNNRDTQGKIVSSHPIQEDDYRKQTPLFSLEFVGVRGYDLQACNETEKAIFLDAIFRRSKITWDVIRNTSHEKLGFEILKDENLNKDLRKNALKNLTPDTTIKVFRARNQTTMRIVGHRDKRIFYILYFDPKGQLYAH